MKVAHYYSNKDIRVEERPVPKIGPGEILMKVKSSGICGSDLMEWYRTQKVPRVLGHEVSGKIVEVGPDVTDLKAGDRIVASHHVPCYGCHYCRLGHHTLCDTLRTTNFDPGGFAQWIRLPKINVRYGIYRIPNNVSFEEATIVEPLACVIRGQKKVDVRQGQTVLVMGCGSSGLLHIMAAKSRGGVRALACDIVDFRLETARQLGADETLKAAEDLPRRIAEANEGRLADVVIVCAGGKEATLQALQCIGRGGVVLFFALHSPDQTISLPLNEVFWQKGATLTSTYAASPENHREAMDLIAEGSVPVSRLITHRLGLSEIAKGFEVASNASKSIKVLIDPTL